MERDWMAVLPFLLAGVLTLAISLFGNIYRFQYYIGAGFLFGGIANLGDVISLGRLTFPLFLVANTLAIACFVWSVVLAIRLNKESRRRRT